MKNIGELHPLIQPSASQGSVDSICRLIPTQSQQLVHENEGIVPHYPSLISFLLQGSMAPTLHPLQPVLNRHRQWTRGDLLLVHALSFQGGMIWHTAPLLSHPERWMTQCSPHMLHLCSHPQLTGAVIVILELSLMVVRLLCWISMWVRVVIYYRAYQYTFLMWFSDTILRQIEDVFLQIIHFLWVDSS